VAVKMLMHAYFYIYCSLPEYATQIIQACLARNIYMGIMIWPNGLEMPILWLLKLVAFYCILAGVNNHAATKFQDA